LIRCEGLNTPTLGAGFDLLIFEFERMKNFIELQPQENAAVILVGFCADFNKENPSSSEIFTSAAMPRNLKNIAGRIARYMANNPQSNITAVQLAVWLSQRETPDSIHKKFGFDADDEALARKIMRY
jgi:hypothetical protein